jgi:hypothetical protein
MKKFYLHMPELPGWQIVFAEMIEKMESSGLIDYVDEINLCMNGVLANMEIPVLPLLDASSKFKVRHVGGDASKWEWPTLNALKEDADSHNEIDYIGYAHLKGLSRPKDPNAIDWRNYLTYWTIEQWQDNINELDKGAEAVGPNLLSYPWPHFSGNFWWANSNYIRRLKKLPDPSTLIWGTESEYLPDIKLDPGNFRFEHEAWIGSAAPNAVELHYSHPKHDASFHYRFPYPESNYRKK